MLSWQVPRTIYAYAWSANAGIKYLVGSIPSFFAPAVGNDSEAAAAGLATCTRPQAHVDFLHAPLFSYQAGTRAHILS